jgi:hypothetical protein
VAQDQGREGIPPGRTTRLARVPLAGGAALVRWSPWDPPWRRVGENASSALPTAAEPVLVDPAAPAADQAVRL